MSDNTPTIYGPDGVTPARADEVQPTTVIFAELVPDHIANAGLAADEKRAAQPEAQRNLVAVKLPANCVMVEPDAVLAAKGDSYLMKLATRAVEILRARGSVRMSVPEQINYAKATIVLFQHLNNQRVKETQLGHEFAKLFEAHAAFEEKAKAEAEEREKTFLESVRQAYLDGIADECDVCGQAGDDFRAGLQRAADAYMARCFGEEPEPAPQPDPPEAPFDRARGDKLVEEVLVPAPLSDAERMQNIADKHGAGYCQGAHDEPCGAEDCYVKAEQNKP